MGGFRIVALLALAGLAFAPGTGGSLGGGDFGHERHGTVHESSGGEATHAPEPTPSTPEPPSSGESGGHSDHHASVAEYAFAIIVYGGAAAVALGFIFAIVLGELRKKMNGGVSTGAAHFSKLDVIVSEETRRSIQRGLLDLAAKGDTATPKGRARALEATTQILVDAAPGWRFAAYDLRNDLSLGEARQYFEGAVARARSRFGTELVRNEDGERVHRARTSVPGVDDDEGYVAVTLVVVTRKLRLEHPRVSDKAGLTAALQERGMLVAKRIVAFEVVWTPAADDDRLGADDLPRLFPNLTKIA